MSQHFDETSNDAMFATILAELKALREADETYRKQNTESLARIEAQTTKTNGRVNKLEAEKTKYLSMVIGGAAVASFVITVVGFILENGHLTTVLTKHP